MASQKSYTERIKALVSRPPGAMRLSPADLEKTPDDVFRPEPTVEMSGDPGPVIKGGLPTGPIIFSAAKSKAGSKPRGISSVFGRRGGAASRDWRVIGLTVAAVALAVVSLALAWNLTVVTPRMERKMVEQEAQIVREAEARRKLEDSLAKKEEELVRIQSTVGVVRVETEPPGAMVTLQGKAGVAPFTFEGVPIGEHNVGAELDGYEPARQAVAVADETPVVVKLTLASSKGALLIDTDPPGASYALTRSGRPVRSGATPDRIADLPVGEYDLSVRKGHAEQRSAVRVTTGGTAEFRHRFLIGGLGIQTVPPGAEVFSGGRALGKTPLVLSDFPAGPSEFEFRLHKHLVQLVRVDVVAGSRVPLSVKLEPNLGPPQGRDFKATSGLEMVWFDRGYWVCRHEVTQEQYRALMGNNPSQNRGPLRPVDSVSWRLAGAFCEKLTKSEDEAEMLPAGFHYALPSEGEWSDFAGPSPITAGVNVLGSTVGTLDVMRAPSNGIGLRGVWGNVWEWCADSGGRGRVLRGGGWSPIYEGLVQIADRTTAIEDEANANFGFRVVLKRR